MAAEDWLTQDESALFDDGMTNGEGFSWTPSGTRKRHYGFRSKEERARYCEQRAQVAYNEHTRQFWLNEAAKARRDEH